MTSRKRTAADYRAANEACARLILADVARRGGGREAGNMSEGRPKFRCTSAASAREDLVAGGSAAAAWSGRWPASRATTALRAAGGAPSGATPRRRSPKRAWTPSRRRTAPAPVSASTPCGSCGTALLHHRMGLLCQAAVDFEGVCEQWIFAAPLSTRWKSAACRSGRSQFVSAIGCARALCSDGARRFRKASTWSG
jgi:hypothetical protein